MKKTKLGTMMIAGLGVLTALSSFSAFAEEDTAAATSTLNSDRPLSDKIADVMALSYWGAFRAGGLTNLGGAYQPDTLGNNDPTNPTSLESVVTIGYKPAKDWTVGMFEHFYYNAAGFMPTPGPYQSNISSGFLQANPSLMVSKANVIDNGNGLHLKLIFSAQLPTASNQMDYINAINPTTGINNGMLTALGPTYILSWDVPKTRLNLGIYGYFMGYIPGSNSPSNLRDYKIYVAPNASYQLTSVLSATMWVDLIQATQNAGSPFIAGMTNPEMDFEPGINWDISPKFSLNPVLNIYPQNMSLAATSFQMYIVGKVF